MGLITGLTFAIFLTACGGGTGGSSGSSGPSPSAIAAGSDHTCARLSDGAGKCWGANASGQLGNGKLTNSPTPVAVTGITTATTLAAGGFQTCVLVAAGTVKCWGSILEPGGDLPFFNSTTPTLVSLGSPALALVAGFIHTCAVLVDRTVKCWGSNLDGELGNGSPASSATPVLVSGLTTVTAIAAGGYVALGHTCVILQDGTLKCWGSNDFGQVGDGTTGNSRFTPVLVSGITTATAVAAGSLHTCALLSDGTVRCWGLNDAGQLGNGTTTNAASPVAVSGLTGGMALAAGRSHTCALVSDGTVKCWGSGSAGQLGTGTLTSVSTPVVVSELATVTAIAAGASHTCARLSNGTVRCWGRNDSGQLGTGTFTDSSIPVVVSGF